MNRAGQGSGVLGAVRYRFRATLGRRWSGYLAIVVLVGIVGGVAMGSIAATRRTQSSYPTFLAATNPSDLLVSVYTPTSGFAGGSLLEKIADLGGVTRVRTLAAPSIVPLSANGAPRLSTLGPVTTIGSTDGALLAQDRLAAVAGRLADPARPDEFVMTATAAKIMGLHVGEAFPAGFYMPSQESLPGFGTPQVPPRLRISARLVGIVVLDDQVVQDDIDKAYGFVIVTPALLHEVTAVAPQEAAPISYGIQLTDGARGVSATEARIVRLIPPGLTAEFHVTSRVVSQVELAVKPESVALGAFGVIAALVCLVLGAQAVSRQLRAEDDDRQILRALGASPLGTAADGLAGVLVAIVAGALLAMAIAVALSPLGPLGPVRPVYPTPGITFDWVVLGIGLALIIVVLAAIAGLVSYQSSPHRRSRRRLGAARPSSVVTAAGAAGFPVAGVIGVRFAVEPSSNRTGAPVRSALLGTALAVLLVVASLTFTSGLTTLVSNPPLYGWNWSYVLAPTNNLPLETSTTLDHDPAVAAWSGYDYNNAEVDGQTVPTLISHGVRLPVAPPVLAGHGLDANNQIVLGAATLAALHKRVGDTVTLSYGTPKDAPLYIPPTRLQVVGTATFPAVGYESTVADHTSMGTGALFSTAVEPRAFQDAVGGTDPVLAGPNLDFVRLRPGVSAADGLSNLRGVAGTIDRMFAADPAAANNNSVTVLGVQHPAQIVNYRTVGSTPVLLAVGLAAGAVIALALTLVVSVRRRRRELALLKALGFTPRQLAATVAWQATVAALVGIVVGVPLGIIAGRQLWTVFARSIDAVPDPTVPTVSVVLVALGALVFANLVAAYPGAVAARTPTALVLRSE